MQNNFVLFFSSVQKGPGYLPSWSAYRRLSYLPPLCPWSAMGCWSYRRLHFPRPVPLPLLPLHCPGRKAKVSWSQVNNQLIAVHASHIIVIILLSDTLCFSLSPESSEWRCLYVLFLSVCQWWHTLPSISSPSLSSTACCSTWACSPSTGSSS